ncbi:hypothetical protein ES708_31104 [subsurface metagenome]
MILDSHIERIKELCKNHKVRNLFVFGSATGVRFSEQSDIDLIVDFNTSDPLEYAENYFSLKFSLEELLNNSFTIHLRVSYNRKKAII